MATKKKASTKKKSSSRSSLKGVSHGRQRAVIESLTPEVDGGRFGIKRTPGEEIVVEADIFADGHDMISAVLCYRHEDAREWLELPMEPLENDRWQASFKIREIGRFVYTVVAWVDHFKTWRRDFIKRTQASQDISLDLLIGANLAESVVPLATPADKKFLRAKAKELRAASEQNHPDRIDLALDEGLVSLMTRNPDRRTATTHVRELAVIVDPPRARFSAWYEFFPRSAAAKPGQHGTFKDCEARLPYVAEMGFDVLYFPPIHPIGEAFRKGKNNNTSCTPDEPGSCWAIGGTDGGHKAIHSELGTLKDFRKLVDSARKLDIQIAMDIAFQCSPDHPYVKDHPDWFKARPDGTIQYAENPPKKYQDIYPFDFETTDWEGLWKELRSVFAYWIKQGVTIFRVDNPHTKSFEFWEWVIPSLKKDHPEVLFLSEAFARPRVMYRLAKLGFSQSYNYFTWRNTKWEIEEYMKDIADPEIRDIFRPNFWPNTPDILPEYLQFGGRAAHTTRLVLAATLSANYGMYGPVFEHCVNEPVAPGKEEYLNSEKYEIQHWNLDQTSSLRYLIGKVNDIRRRHTALQSDGSLRFHPVDNEQIIAYSKSTGTTGSIDSFILVVVNLDPHHSQAGFLELPLAELGLDPHHSYQMHDLLTDSRYLWNGERNYVELHPEKLNAHIFALRRRAHTEKDVPFFR